MSAAASKPIAGLRMAPVLIATVMRDALPHFREDRATQWLDVAILIVGHTTAARRRVAASTHFSLS